MTGCENHYRKKWSDAKSADKSQLRGRLQEGKPSSNPCLIKVSVRTGSVQIPARWGLLDLPQVKNRRGQARLVKKRYRRSDMGTSLTMTGTPAIRSSTKVNSLARPNCIVSFRYCKAQSHPVDMSMSEKT